MVLTDESSELLDIINFSRDRHTAENMLTLAIDILQQSVLKNRMSSVKCVTTDSPSAMIKYRRRMAEDYNHMLTLPCALHVANTLCKDICKINRIKCVIRRNCAVVNFFVASHLWFALANEWAEQRKYSFQSLCEFRWHSMTKVCLSICYYKDSLRDASSKCGTMEECPPIRNEVFQRPSFCQQ